MRRIPWVLSAVLLASVLGTSAAVAVEWKEASLHGFRRKLDGSGPSGGLIFDTAGNLYGTTRSGGKFGYGEVFRLTPPTLENGAWSEAVLHSFTGGADGGNSYASLSIDTAGNLYGTTANGGRHGLGVVFRLSPPSSERTAWTEAVLYSFTGGKDGGRPFAGVVLDATGNLYGSNDYGGAEACNAGRGCGTVFELKAPATAGKAWSETVLHTFTGSPDGAGPNSVVFGPDGSLYGTTAGGGAEGACGLGCGTVFKLKPPLAGKAKWSETILYAFTDFGGPDGSVIFDSNGNLLGTEVDGGSFADGDVFELIPPKPGESAWAEQVLYSFDQSDGLFPSTGVIIDSVGSLYGTTFDGGSSGEGIVFRLIPPANGQTAWTEKVLYEFKANTSNSGPSAGLIFDAAGNLYGETLGDGKAKLGTIFRLSR